VAGEAVYAQGAAGRGAISAPHAHVQHAIQHITRTTAIHAVTTTSATATRAVAARSTASSTAGFARIAGATASATCRTGYLRRLTTSQRR